MNDRMTTGMAEATRLTRMGQLSEATAIIQRTLRGMLAPDASPNTTDCPADEPIDVSFCVIDVAPRPMAVSGQEWDDQTSSSAVATSSPPDDAVPSGERTYTQSEPREDQHSVAPAIIPSTRGSTCADFMPAAIRRHARVHTTLPPFRSRLGELVSRPMSDRSCREIWAGG